MSPARSAYAMPRVLACVLALLVSGEALGCGGDDDGRDAGGDGGDAAVDGGGDAGVQVAAPATPVLSPCAPGFAEVGEPARCEPYEDGVRGSCGAAEAHFPGEAGCAPVGASCPAGEWPEELPASGVRYVRPLAEGGDGTMALPFGTIRDALSGAPVGTVVALAKGTYDENVDLPTGVTLRGACPAETFVTTELRPRTMQDGIITVDGDAVVIADLTITGTRSGLVLLQRAEATLEGVVIDAATSAAVTVFPNATLSGDGVLVRDTVAADGIYGLGVALAPSATLTMRRLAVLGCTAAVSALGSTVSLEDSLLADGVAQPSDGRQGVALDALGGSDVTIRRSVIEGHRERALVVYEADTTVLIEDSVVRDTAGRASDGGEGRGAFVFEGGSLTMRRSALSGHHEVALLVTDAGSRVVLEDALIEGTVGRMADGAGGSALSLQDGAEGVLERVILAGNRGIALVAFSGSALRVTDVTISDTESETLDGRFGVGLHAQGGSSVDGERVAISNSRQAGLSAAGIGTRVTLADASIIGTRERACAVTTCPELGIGDGVLSSIDASISLDGFVVQGSARAGVHIAAAGVMDLRRGSIADNAIGAVIQTPGFDVARISEGVTYVGNGRNLDMSALPLPEPPAGI